MRHSSAPRCCVASLLIKGDYGGKFMVRGGSFEIAEGRDLGARHVVIEFPSLEAARNCYNSEAYTHAKKHRQAVSEGTIILVEGND